MNIVPKLRMNPKEHFWVRGLKRSFDLSALVPLYLYVSKNLDTIARNTDLEFSIGRTTIIYAVNQQNNIDLISGWVGERKKKRY